MWSCIALGQSEYRVIADNDHAPVAYVGQSAGLINRCKHAPDKGEHVGSIPTGGTTKVFKNMNRREDKKAKEQFEALMAQNAKTHALDRLDVREGRLSSQALSWFSQDYVRSLTLTVPEYGMPVSEGAMEGQDSNSSQLSEREGDPARQLEEP